MFNYNSSNNRMSADCLDVYNWLLTINEKIAGKFKRKYFGALNEIKKK